MSPKLPKPNLAEIAAKQGDDIDSRYHPSAAVRRQLNKVFPTHWSFLLGEIALYSFIVLLLTGTYLAFFFVPSLNEVQYEGSYRPLQGIHMSAAYASTLDLSFDIRGGLLGITKLFWALGGAVGIDPGRLEDRDLWWHLLTLSMGVWSLAGAWGILVLTTRRGFKWYLFP